MFANAPSANSLSAREVVAVRVALLELAPSFDGLALVRTMTTWRGEAADVVRDVVVLVFVVDMTTGSSVLFLSIVDASSTTSRSGRLAERRRTVAGLDGMQL